MWGAAPSHQELRSMIKNEIMAELSGPDRPDANRVLTLSMSLNELQTNQMAAGFEPVTDLLSGFGKAFAPQLEALPEITRQWFVALLKEEDDPVADLFAAALTEETVSAVLHTVDPVWQLLEAQRQQGEIRREYHAWVGERARELQREWDDFSFSAEMNARNHVEDEWPLARWKSEVRDQEDNNE